MRYLHWTLPLIVIAALAVPTFAAGDSQQSKPFSVETGIFIPSQTNALFRGRVLHPMIGAGYTLGQVQGSDSDSSIKASINAEYIGNAYGLSVVPITLAFTARSFANQHSTYVPFEGLAVGDYLARAGGQSKQLFGGYLFLGLDMGQSRDWFVEAKYHIVAHFETSSIDGTDLSVGYRF